MREREKERERIKLHRALRRGDKRWGGKRRGERKRVREEINV